MFPDVIRTPNPSKRVATDHALDRAAAEIGKLWTNKTKGFLS
jgi:hypothetical protein